MGLAHAVSAARCLCSLAPDQVRPPTQEAEHACAGDWLQRTLTARGAGDVAALSAAVALSQLGSHPISECVAALNASLPSDVGLPEVADFRVRPGQSPSSWARVPSLHCSRQHGATRQAGSRGPCSRMPPVASWSMQATGSQELHQACCLPVWLSVSPGRDAVWVCTKLLTRLQETAWCCSGPAARGTVQAGSRSCTPPVWQGPLQHQTSGRQASWGGGGGTTNVGGVSLNPASVQVVAGFCPLQGLDQAELCRRRSAGHAGAAGRRLPCPLWLL